VFVGWNQIIGGQGWGSQQDFWNFRTLWMQDWSRNWAFRTVTEAYDNAANNWPPGGISQLHGALRVYGYTNMLFNVYNRKSDWAWP
jgi:hypothetical protein